VLGRRGGDADTATWLVVKDGEVRGLVRRYQRSDGSLSLGWEALWNAGTALIPRGATADGSWSDQSNFLWRSRDLGAWGVATDPSFHAPAPEWATDEDEAARGQ
jgi:hypothetical protein